MSVHRILDGIGLQQLSNLALFAPLSAALFVYMAIQYLRRGNRGGRIRESRYCSAFLFVGGRCHLSLRRWQSLDLRLRGGLRFRIA